MRSEMNYTEFSRTNPTPAQFVEWNRSQMLTCIERGDSHNAGVYAVELAHWSLSLIHI